MQASTLLRGAPHLLCQQQLHSPSRPAPLSAVSRSVTVPSRRQPARKDVAGPCRVAAPEAPGTNVAPAQARQLAELDFHPIINTQGLVAPSVEPGTVAWVVAIYDEQQKLQYVGFSQNLRNTLRTVVARRPEKSFFYKSQGIASLDQAAMVAIRDAWFEQIGGAPPGNKLALERNQWQAPVDAGAISARGKRAAAEDKARQILEQLKLRGCTEEFVPNPSLLDEGRVDFLPAQGLSEDEVAQLRRAQEAAAAATRAAKAVIDGEERSFKVRYKTMLKTKGGWLVDVAVTLDNRETVHRVIVGSQYVDLQGLPGPEPAVEAALAVLLCHKLPRHTDGLMSIGQFPVNYFTISEVEQWWPEDFVAAFELAAGRALSKQDGKGTVWRFIRLHSYGSATADEPHDDQRNLLASQMASEGHFAAWTF